MVMGEELDILEKIFWWRRYFGDIFGGKKWKDGEVCRIWWKEKEGKKIGKRKENGKREDISWKKK